MAQYNPRFAKLSDAEAFLNALDFDPSASPYSFGAIPPFISEITQSGLRLITNPEWGLAKYEMTYFVNRPDASQVKAMHENNPANKASNG